MHVLCTHCRGVAVIELIAEAEWISACSVVKTNGVEGQSVLPTPSCWGWFAYTCTVYGQIYQLPCSATALTIRCMVPEHMRRTSEFQSNPAKARRRVLTSIVKQRQRAPLSTAAMICLHRSVAFVGTSARLNAADGIRLSYRRQWAR